MQYEEQINGYTIERLPGAYGSYEKTGLTEAQVREHFEAFGSGIDSDWGGLTEPDMQRLLEKGGRWGDYVVTRQ